MAVAFGGPVDGRPPNRRVVDLLSGGLAGLARKDAGSVPERAEESERLLRSAVEALLGLARRTPGFDLTVAVGPGNGPAVRLHYTQEGLVTDRLTARGRSGSREALGPALDESALVSELASMLWSGEVEPNES